MRQTVTHLIIQSEPGLQNKDHRSFKSEGLATDGGRQWIWKVFQLSHPVQTPYLGL